MYAGACFQQKELVTVMWLRLQGGRLGLGTQSEALLQTQMYCVKQALDVTL